MTVRFKAITDYALPTTFLVDDISVEVCCPDDAHEPNDSFAAARMVSPGTHDVWLCPNGDEDWLQFNVAAGKTIVADLTPAGAAQCDVCLYRPDGSQAACSANPSPTAPEHIERVANQSGAWRVRVYDPASGTSTAASRIRIQVLSQATSTPTRTATRAASRRARLPIVMKNYRAFGDDSFSSTTLDARWSWINPDPAKWSLTASSGFLRILTTTGSIGSRNLAIQNAPNGDYTVQTRLLFTPTGNYQIAGIAVYKDSANYLMLGRGYCNLAPPLCRGNGIYFDHIEANTGVGSNFAMSTKTGEAYLRIVKRGNTYTAYYSENGSAWTLVGAHTVGVALPGVGLTAAQDVSNTQIPADFDYFDISPPTN